MTNTIMPYLEAFSSGAWKEVKDPGARVDLGVSPAILHGIDADRWLTVHPPNFRKSRLSLTLSPISSNCRRLLNP